MNYMEKGTERSINMQIENAPYTTIKTGRVISKQQDGYVVEINGVQYGKLMVLNGVSLTANNIVQLLVPNNNMSNMFILGKLSY